LRKKMSIEVKEQSSIYEECLRKGVLPNGKRISPCMDSPESIKNILSAGERIYLEILESIRMSNKGQAILMDKNYTISVHFSTERKNSTPRRP